MSPKNDSRPHFEFNVSFPYDLRFAETLRLLAVHAAESAGSSGPVAEAFGRTVERVVQDAIKKWPKGSQPDTELDVVIRRGSGPVEVVIGPRTLTAEP